MKTIQVEKFHKYLIARNEIVNKHHNAQKFVTTYLKELESQSWWDGTESITLDFTNVETISPAFANEAFARFGKYKNVTWEKFQEKVKMINISTIKLETIKNEVLSGTGETSN